MSMARRLGRGVIIPARAREARPRGWGTGLSDRPHTHHTIHPCNTVIANKHTHTIPIRFYPVYFVVKYRMGNVCVSLIDIGWFEYLCMSRFVSFWSKFVCVCACYKTTHCVTKLRVHTPPRGACFSFLLLFDNDAVIVFVLECPPIFWCLSTGIEEILSHRELGRERRREFEIVVVTETFPVRLTLCIEGFLE